MKQERVQHHHRKTEEETEEVDNSVPSEIDIESVDKLLEEIDDVLEKQGLNDEAEIQSWVANYIQKGGE